MSKEKGSVGQTRMRAHRQQPPASRPRQFKKDHRTGVIRDRDPSYPPSPLQEPSDLVGAGEQLVFQFHDVQVFGYKGGAGRSRTACKGFIRGTAAQQQPVPTGLANRRLREGPGRSRTWSSRSDRSIGH